MAGSPADVPGASGVGMPVVWLDRIGLAPANAAIEPVAMYGSLTLLPLVLGREAHLN